ncbi:MAG TPA: helix-turn-helix transcriptional regulator [Candidatus Dojkabacteria bacterium]|nr:helix-turn-helix transcriptional regulator [Candidatus Dojkabacteria bacterium]
MEQNYIGENIRRYRERAKLTQQQLADKIGITWEMVSRYERNESSPIHRLDDLSKALSISKSEILEKHIPERYSHIEYRVPLFIQYPSSKKFTSGYTNYYYICPEWILKRDRECIAIDTALIESDYEEFGKSGIVYISTQVKPELNDLILVKGSNQLITERYRSKNGNILGKILAQEVRY